MATIEINTAAEFMALYTLPEESRGTADNLLEININADLDFSGIDNAPSNSEIYFYANVNGNGHIIKNIAWSETAECALLKFRAGSISNLTLDNCAITVTGANLYVFYCMYNLSDMKFAISEIIVNNNCKFTSTTGYCSLLFYTYLNGNYYLKNDKLTVEKISIAGTWTGRYLYLFYLSVYTSNSNNIRAYFKHVGVNIVGFALSSNPTFNLIFTNNSVYVYASYVYNISSILGFSGTPSNNGLAYVTQYGYLYMSYCYASMDVDNSSRWNQIANNDSTRYIYCVFSNSDKLGSTINSTPATTDELKSVEWLRSQGWVI